MFLDLNMSLWYSWILCLVLLVIGIFLLVKCSDIFVGGSASIARKMKISPMIIGLTVVAFGTSCPELAVSVSDSITCLINGGNANVAMGNIVGSNICNLLIVLGFSAVFTPIIIKRSVCKKEYPILILVSIIFTIFTLLFGLNVNGVKTFAILRIEGIILVIGIILYVWYLVHDAKKQIKNGLVDENNTEEEIKEMKTSKSIFYIILGAIGIVLGGEAVVFGSKNIAYGIGDLASLNKDLVESLVGLTIVAVGTSLPELVTSVVAAKKGENEIALGNVIGSNIFNILFVIGIAATVNPLTVGNQIWIDMVIMLAATLVVFIFALSGKINKMGGLTLLILYLIYLGYLILRTVNQANSNIYMIVLFSLYAISFILVVIFTLIKKKKE